MIYFLGLGSNDGDRELHLRNALNYLAEKCNNLYFSTHYASPALKGKGPLKPVNPHYLNSVAMVDFNGDDEELNILLKECERCEGRDAKAREEGRVPLDMDIVIAGNRIVRPKDYSMYFFRRGYEELLSLIGKDQSLDPIQEPIQEPTYKSIQESIQEPTKESI